RSSAYLLHSRRTGADRGGVPARADELVPCGALGSAPTIVRARRVAPRADLSTPIGPLPRPALPLLLFAQAQRRLGARRGIRGGVETSMAHRAPRLRHVRYVDARLLL